MAYFKEPELDLHIERHLKYCELEEQRKDLLQKYNDLKGARSCKQKDIAEKEKY